MATLLEELMYVCVRVVGRVYVAMKWERREVCCNGKKMKGVTVSKLVAISTAYVCFTMRWRI